MSIDIMRDSLHTTNCTPQNNSTRRNRSTRHATAESAPTAASDRSGAHTLLGAAGPHASRSSTCHGLARRPFCGCVMQRCWHHASTCWSLVLVLLCGIAAVASATRLGAAPRSHQLQSPLPWHHQWGAPDPLNNCRLLADCLYTRNDLSDACIPTYCQPSVVQHGDGVWLPRAPFQGAGWVTALHRELFSAYTAWDFKFLELAATAGAAKGFTDVIGFFHWEANNTGAYHGQSPSRVRSGSYGVMHFTTDKSARVTDLTIWRAGFAEERQVLLLQPEYEDVITPLRDITQQPFWIPSQSLQLRMVTHAHTLIEVLNQGEKFLDSLDDVAVSNVILIDGMAIWGPAKAVGLTDLKLWLAGWLQLYDVSVAVTASTATPTSNKVFLCIKMLLSGGESGGGRTSQVDGCVMYVFNISGYITHMVLYRNGTPQEVAEKFIGGGGVAGALRASLHS